MRLQCYPTHVLLCRMQLISHIAAIRIHILTEENTKYHIFRTQLEEDKLTTLNIQCIDVFVQNPQPSAQFLNYLATHYS